MSAGNTSFSENDPANAGMVDVVADHRKQVPQTPLDFLDAPREGVLR